MTSSSSSSSAFALDSFSYGKSLVRLLRVVRDSSNPQKQDVIEYTVQSLLTGPTLDTSYTEGDNTLVVPTDTQKNTIHYFAKTLDGVSVLCPEKFALELGNHFVKRYDHVTKCTIDVIAQKWSRIELDDGPHPHAFVRDGDEKRTVFVQTEKAKVNGQDTVVCTQLKGGMKDLLVLKSSGSAFHSFWRDEFTTLKAVNDRIFSTSVECHYNFALPTGPLSEYLSSPSLPDFNSISSCVRKHTLRVFATHESASVQATLYLMCTEILGDAPTTDALVDVGYALPNKHYVPINLGWAKLDNLSETTAEVFHPQADPSGFIKAVVKRTGGAGATKL